MQPLGWMDRHCELDSDPETPHDFAPLRLAHRAAPDPWERNVASSRPMSKKSKEDPHPGVTSLLGGMWTPQNTDC